MSRAAVHLGCSITCAGRLASSCRSLALGRTDCCCGIAEPPWPLQDLPGHTGMCWILARASSERKKTSAPARRWGGCESAPIYSRNCCVAGDRLRTIRSRPPFTRCTISCHNPSAASAALLRSTSASGLDGRGEGSQCPGDGTDRPLIVKGTREPFANEGVLLIQFASGDDFVDGSGCVDARWHEPITATPAR